MGLKVKEFMFGLPGPRVFSFRVGETEYGATWIPFGGYVKFAGIESELQMEEDDEDKDVPPERKYDTQPRWKKALIMLAGPSMNMVLPIILLAAVLMFQGVPNKATTTIGEVVKGSAAYKAGLKADDRIIVVEGKKVKSWDDMVSTLKKKPGQQITIVVKRDSKTITVKPTLGSKDGTGFLGVSSKIEYKRVPPHIALYKGAIGTYDVIKFMVITLYTVIVHKPSTIVNGSAGPVGIVSESAKIAQQSFWQYVWFLALISINIGIINLLPFPPLDGGRLAILGVEAIKRGPINRKIIFAINAVGMALLLTLMVYFVFTDISKIIRGIPIIGGG